MLTQLSIACVGVRFPNKKGGNRQFEIAVCQPGEPVTLEHEPRNPADGNAIDRNRCEHPTWTAAVAGLVQRISMLREPATVW